MVVEKTSTNFVSRCDISGRMLRKLTWKKPEKPKNRKKSAELWGKSP